MERKTFITRCIQIPSKINIPRDEQQPRAKPETQYAYEYYAYRNLVSENTVIFASW